MITNLSYNSESMLNQFATEQWDRSLAYLRKQFSLSEDDCQDIFQEAFITLHENIKTGKLKELTSSLSTYFISICRFKAFELIRSNGKKVPVEDDLSLSIMNGEVLSNKIEGLIALDKDEETIEQRKNELVRKIVKDLPHPCNELLWSFYRDNFDMKTIAQMFNYSSAGSAKVTTHKCREKFRNRYTQQIKSIF